MPIPSQTIKHCVADIDHLVSLEKIMMLLPKAKALFMCISRLFVVPIMITGATLLSLPSYAGYMGESWGAEGWQTTSTAINGVNELTFNLDSVGNTQHGYGGAAVSVLREPSPSLAASVFLSPGSNRETNNIYFHYTLQYSIAVNGPDAGNPPSLRAPVPVRVRGSYSGEISGFYVSAGLSVQAYDSNNYSNSFSTATHGNYSSNAEAVNSSRVPIPLEFGGGFDGFLYSSAGSQINTYLNINLQLSAGCFYGWSLCASSVADVFVDPYFYIDPDWLLENPGYSLDSGDVGNSPRVTSVPEPAGIALFALGGAALWLRRRREVRIK